MDIYKAIWKISLYIISQYESLPHCEICGKIMVAYKFIPFTPLKELPFLLYQCTDCEFASINHSMIREKEIKDFYTNLILTNRNFYSELVNKENKDNYFDLLSLEPRPSVVLDFGSGVGGLEYFAKRDGGKIKVFSFDICKETIEYAATQGITVYPVDIVNKQKILAQVESLGISKIDGIYCSNTIEHLKSPGDTLLMWAELLGEGGFLYLLMPSMDYIFFEKLMYQNTHFSYWTEDTFTKLINSIGLKVRLSKVFNIHNIAGTGYMKFIVEVK